ncbi:F-box protein [Sesamum alatum]|uniref:F-box protein n=1 Tax=Sesamum alatum TaxID=300844 RepID=A0AAE1YXU3_9LAMI|nr:F-box protein [Sesamum alatum]
MESLPDAIVQHILSLVSNAKDVASCNCVSKRWKDSMPYLRSLFFPRNLFDNLTNGNTPDAIVSQMVSSIVKLEQLVVYCPFSSSALVSWLSMAGPSLKNLELRMDDIIEHQNSTEIPLKLDCLGAARNLESLKLWGVLMIQSPKWDVFYGLKNLEIVGATVNDFAVSVALRACPNLTHLLLLGCEGLRSISIENPHIQQCKLDFFGAGNCSLMISSSKLESLEVQGCSCIRVLETQCLKNLSISNHAGQVHMVDFGKLVALETLSIRGVQWCWDAVSNIVQMASEVKHLYMKVEFTGDTDNLQPFPEIDFVDFFNSHPKLETFEIHGAMFAALCKKNSLENVESGFMIPHLEKVVVTVRSPLNAEQKMSMLDSLIKYARNLKWMTIKILQMKSSHRSTDDFFEDICRFRYMNREIVSIE